jgi:hypothetical protein
MKVTAAVIAQVRELVGRGMSPLNIARSMATNVDEIRLIINALV